MNANRKLSEKTYGPRHTQPHMPAEIATKKRSAILPATLKGGKQRYDNK